LKFKCINHGITAEVKTVEDFAKVPEGGCTKPCNLRMDCGHTCPSLCHPYEKTDSDPTGHDKIICHKKCQRETKCGHPCQFECH
jgi:hypothetical protein